MTLSPHVPYVVIRLKVYSRASFTYLSGCGIQGVRSSGSCVSVIVLQPEEVLLAVEYPIGRTDGFGTVAQYRHGAFVE